MIAHVYPRIIIGIYFLCIWIFIYLYFLTKRAMVKQNASFKKIIICLKSQLLYIIMYIILKNNNIVKTKVVWLTFKC